MRTGSISEAYVEYSRVIVDRNERWTVVSQWILGQGLALDGDAG